MAVLLSLSKNNVIFALQVSFFAFVAAPTPPCPFSSPAALLSLYPTETPRVALTGGNQNSGFLPIQNCLLPPLGKSKERQVNPGDIHERVSLFPSTPMDGSVATMGLAVPFKALLPLGGETTITLVCECLQGGPQSHVPM